MAKRRAHGEGSIYQIADGTWRGSVQIGEGRRKYVRGETRTEVVRQVVELRARIEQGMPTMDGRVRVGQYLAQWLEEVVMPARRPRTYDSYAANVRLYLVPAIGGVRLVDLTPGHIQRLINSLAAEGKVTTALRVHSTIRRALNQALRWGLITRNVATVVDLPHQEKREMRPFTADEARQFLAAIEGDRLEALYAVALSMGLRRGEACGLRWEEIDLDAGELQLRYQLQANARGPGAIVLYGHYGLVPVKSHKSKRPLLIPPTLCNKLRQHRSRQARDRLLAGSDWHDLGLVFTTRRGTPLDARNVSRWFNLALQRTDLPAIRFHDLRHSCATLLAAQDVPLSEIMAILGHAQIQTTMAYVHPVTDVRRQATTRLDDLLWGTGA